MRRDGWKTTSGGAELRFRCNKEHVNVRGYVSETASERFQVFVRNANAGYVLHDDFRDGKFKSFDECVKLAKWLLENTEPPPLPEWDKTALPDPIKLDEASGKIQIMKRSTTDFMNGERIDAHSARIVNRIYSAWVVGIVSVNQDCSVDVKSVYDPAKDAWFLVKCKGDKSNGVYMVSDGTIAYLVRKPARKSKFFRVSMSHVFNGVDYSNMAPEEAMLIKKACKFYCEQMQSQSWQK